MQVANEIKLNANRISQAQAGMSDLLLNEESDGTHFDPSKKIPESSLSLSEVDSLITTMSLGAKEIVESTDLKLIPLKFLKNINARLSNIGSTYESAIQKLKEGRPFNSINPEQYSYVDNVGQQLNLVENLKSIANHIDDALAEWHLLRLAAKAPRINDFSHFVRLHSKSRDDLDAALTGIRSSRTEIDGILADAKNNANSIDESKSEIDRIKDHVDSDRRTINDLNAEAAAKVEIIRRASTDADALTGAIREYQANFDEFQLQLDQRTKRLSDGNSELTQLIQRLKEKEEAIEHLIEQSEGMLVGATNVGLAGSISKRLDDISKETLLARWFYYFAIVFLAISTIPLAQEILPAGLFNKIAGFISDGAPQISTVVNSASKESSGHIIAKALFLIPAILLVRFAGARHERLFRLREHYAYKFSIASSVEGFKKQSPDEFKDYVALTAFNELTFNPAMQMDAKGIETKHPNPLLEAILKKVGLSPEHSQ